MPKTRSIVPVAVLTLATAALTASTATPQTTTAIPLDKPSAFVLQGAVVETADYRGRHALKVTQTPDARSSGGDNSVAVLKDTTFRDGTIEVDVAGAPAAGAPEGARGFIGIVFRVAPDIVHHERIYLRPTNGRAEDQLRRNHSTQYSSHPDYPWARLRKENPGVYESYVDLEPGVWTRMKVVVKGTTARLFVNDAPQPCLIVNDLKLGQSEGAIGLWIGPGTEGYFSNLRISR